MMTVELTELLNYVAQRAREGLSPDRIVAELVEKKEAIDLLAKAESISRIRKVRHP